MRNTLNLRNMSIFALAIVLASVLSTLIIVAGSLAFTFGFGQIVYNFIAVIISAAIPLFVGINIGM